MADMISAARRTIVIADKTKFGVFFGDNTGLALT